MFLALSNSRDETTDYLLRKLAGAGIQCLRIDSDTFYKHAKIIAGVDGARLVYGGRPYSPHQFSQVWLRRPERLKFSIGGDDAENEHGRREWAAAMEGLLAQIPKANWINHPTANAVASHKIDQLARASAFGLAVPATLLTQDVREALSFLRGQRHGIVAKPLASSYLTRPDGKDSLIYTSLVTETDLVDSGIAWACPTLLQQRIEKQTDVRVTVVDDAMVAYAIDRQTDIGQQVLDVRTDNMHGATYRSVQVPETERIRLLNLLHAYGLRFAAVDFVVDKSGRWFFLEVNPNGQWAWLDLYGGAEIWRLFLDTARRPMGSRITHLSPVDSATWLALRMCRIDVTREQVCARRYDQQQYIAQIRPDEARDTKELLDYAIATFERANDRRKSIDEKAKLLGGFVTFAITICGATASRVAEPLAMLPALVLFVIALLLLLSYFRLGIVSQPSVTAAEGRQDATDLVKQLIADYLSSADHNERSTSFCGDIFRAAVTVFMAGIIALTMAIPFFVAV